VFSIPFTIPAITHSVRNAAKIDTRFRYAQTRTSWESFIPAALRAP